MNHYNNIKVAVTELVECWGENGERVIELALHERKEIEMKDFLDHCTACGGNWGGMLLSGVRKLYPQTWEAIPEKMGAFAFGCICDVLTLCGVYNEDDK